MKKLTAGIFTVLMGLVTVNAAEAAVASKGYVDEVAKATNTTVTTLTQTVAANKEAAETAIAAAQSAAEDTAAAALNEYKTTNDAAVTALDGRLDEAEDDITALQGEVADMTSGENSVAAKIAAAVAIEESARKAADADLQADIDAINNAETGILADAKAYADGLATNYDAKGSAATALADAKTYADGLATNYDAAGSAATALTNANAYTDTEIEKIDIAYKAADTAINDKIGTVESGKTVVQMIADAKTAATYDDTELTAKVNANEAAIAENALDIKANADAIAGLDSTYVKDSDFSTFQTSNTAAISAAQKAADDAQTAADNAQATANAAIPAPTGLCQDAANKCVLTYNNTAYAWEVIERADGETVE